MKKTIWYASTDNHVRFFDSETCIDVLTNKGGYGSFEVNGDISGLNVESLQSLEQTSQQAQPQG